MGDIELLIILRIRDPEARALVRGHLANDGFIAVTDNIWELPAAEREDPELWNEHWDAERSWFEETIDPRSDMILLWSVVQGRMVRSAIGAGD